MELSSFQLDLMTASPHIGAILNITPNHLDRHKTMEAYTKAKANIIANQMPGDIAVLGYDDPNTLALRDLVHSGDPVFFSGRVPQDVGAWLVDDHLVCRPRFDLPLETVCSVSEIPLRGYHNVLNVLAACAIAGAAGIPISAMREAVLKFRAVEHRLEVVRVVEGVTYVNDSIATAPERVVAALEAYPDEKVVLLLGGRDKNLPWESLAKMAAQRCRAVITFGESGMMIAGHIARARSEAGVDLPLEQASSMAEVVRLAAEFAVDGDVVLLSPGGTSFDAYPDFEARGKDFREKVKAL
jgi:UDP-N-acetylmuramoylalanine--D-glutamate ligase